MPEESRQDVLVAVAHGSKDPRAAATTEALMSLVRERAGGVLVRTAYLGHAAPSLPQVLATLGPHQRVTVLPLLLTPAYHSKTDIPRILAHTPWEACYGTTLGPHPALLTALERRLAVDPAEYASTAVILASAGSSDHAANATIMRLAAQWRESAGWHAVIPAYASAMSPSPAEAVTAALARGGARRVVVATYLLAPGHFSDLIRAESLAAGAALVSPALGAAPEVADVLLDRYAQARQARLTAA